MDAPSRMHQLSTKLTDISMSISAQNKARRSQIDAKIEELDRKIEGLHQQVAKLSFSLSAKIDSDHKDRRTSSQKVISRVDELEAALKQERAQKEAMHASFIDMQKEVQGMRIALSANQAEMARLASAVVGEQRVREESEVTMVRLIEDVCSRVQRELTIERGERERSVDQLLRVLEGTCTRLEDGLLRAGTDP